MMNEFLIRKAKKGDKDAFCRLMDEQVQCMYKVAFSYLKNDEDAADAIQDTIPEIPAIQSFLPQAKQVFQDMDDTDSDQ